MFKSIDIIDGVVKSPIYVVMGLNRILNYHMYYEKRVKEMSLKVLNKHRGMNREGNLVSLNTNKR